MIENLQPRVKKIAKPEPVRRSLSAEASVLDRAVEVIGARSEAMRWMGTPVRALDYATPVSLLATAKGRATVLAVLGKLEHGVM
jgi:putative toxin-antitoxin system antitoxin component (TIGR02293 family)